MSRILKRILFHSVLVLLPFLIMEGVFRLLPVSYPPYILPVSSENPVARFQPDVDYLFSAGWNFSIRASKRSNNFGYINLSDYRPDEATPLLMVIGDSFVEAHHVDAGRSAAEILHSAVEGEGRVYSIGLSGAALSQYLVFAEFSRTTFRPDAMAFVIIANDFDESLLKYMSDPRFHYFEESGSEFVLRRIDYELSTTRKILRKSAFVRYVMLNSLAGHVLDDISRSLRRFEDSPAYSHEASATPEQRIVDSTRAVDHFLDQLPARSGLDTGSIVFVLDAMLPPATYYSPKSFLQAEDSYVSRIRQYFKQQAGSRGYEVVDMQPAFMRRHRLDNSKFYFPADGHWNELGHELVADEIRKSAVFTRIYRKSKAIPGASAAPHGGLPGRQHGYRHGSSGRPA